MNVSQLLYGIFVFSIVMSVCGTNFIAYVEHDMRVLHFHTHCFAIVSNFYPQWHAILVAVTESNEGTVCDKGT